MIIREAQLSEEITIEKYNNFLSKNLSHDCLTNYMNLEKESKNKETKRSDGRNGNNIGGTYDLDNSLDYELSEIDDEYEAYIDYPFG